MAKLTLNAIGSRYGSIDALNDNFDAIEQALENTLSLDGTSPNALEVDLDMNSNDILNAGEINTDTLRINGVLVEPTTGVTAGAAFQTYSYTATAGQTTFSVTPATPFNASIVVIVNGLQLSPTEISVSGTNVITPALTLGDEVVIRRYTAEPVASPDASEINFIQAGTGAVTRTVQDQLRITASDLSASGATDAAAFSSLPCFGAVSVNLTRTVINRHAFEDTSNLNTTDTGLGYASFDAYATMTNPSNQDHFHGYQSRGVYNGAGTLLNTYGYWSSLQHTGAGNISNHIAFRATDIAGSGPVSSSYGIFVDPITRGSSNNYAIWTQGTALSHFGGGFDLVKVPKTWTTINRHAFEDQSVLNTTDTGLGYAGYDAQATLSNPLAQDHMHGFQSRNVLAGAGTVLNSYGFWAATVHNGAGNLSNYIGLRVADLAGAGPVSSCYGIFIDPLTRGGSNNYAIWNNGAARIYSVGMIEAAGGVKTAFVASDIPVVVTGTTHTVGATSTDILVAASGTCTLTLPNASGNNTGRELWVKTTSANGVVSASSNVYPLDSNVLGTAILAATAGKWARLKSNGTTWTIMAGN